jgi:DNA (cytosine-5)-methyltransferase 1
VFVVACLGDWRAPAEVLSLREGLRGYLETRNKKRKGATDDAGASVEAGGKLFDKQAIGQYGDNGVASTCAARDYKDATDLIVPTILDRAAFNQGQNAQYEPLIEQTETCPTIVSRGPHAVQVPFRKSKRASSVKEPIKPLMFKVLCGSPVETGAQGGKPGKAAGKGYLGSEDKAFTIATAPDQWLAQPMAVRRLTPIECERLQGFPDNYSQIPWKGKPAEQCPDGPRYKACGNSMAVPVMRWIGERIQKQIDGTNRNKV